MTVFDGVQVRHMGSGLKFPEGPVVEEDGSVLVCEVEDGALVRVSPEGRHTVVAEFATGANGAAIGPDGAVYVATNGGYVFDVFDGANTPVALSDGYVGGALHRVDRVTGAVEELFTESDGQHLGALNDVVFDAHGGAYVADTTNNRLHYAVLDEPRIGVATADVVTPNGVGLSPDGTRLYVSETFTGRVRIFGVVGPGELVAMPDLYQHPASIEVASDEAPDLTRAKQFWDGLAVDAEGNVAVADLTASGIRVIDANGVHIGSFQTPVHDPSVTCLAFGGPDGNTAYITSGGRGLLYAVEWPWRGGRVNFQP